MVFKSHMFQALDEARAAGARGEVPVGAVVVAPDGRVVAAAGNRTRELLRSQRPCRDAGDPGGLRRGGVRAAAGT